MAFSWNATQYEKDWGTDFCTSNSCEFRTSNESDGVKLDLDREAFAWALCCFRTMMMPTMHSHDNFEILGPELSFIACSLGLCQGGCWMQGIRFRVSAKGLRRALRVKVVGPSPGLVPIPGAEIGFRVLGLPKIYSVTGLGAPSRLVTLPTLATRQAD